MGKFSDLDVSESFDLMDDDLRDAMGVLVEGRSEPVYVSPFMKIAEERIKQENAYL